MRGDRLGYKYKIRRPMSYFLGEYTEFPHKDDYTVLRRNGFFEDLEVLGHFNNRKSADDFIFCIKFPLHTKGLAWHMRDYKDPPPLGMPSKNINNRANLYEILEDGSFI